MRGIERRSDGRGRRTTDHPGLWGRPYERALFLSALLILSMALLLVARDQSRPERELDGLNHDALVLDARLYAQTIAQQLADLDRLLNLAETHLANAPGQPLQSLETAVASLPHSGILLSTAQGTPLVAVGRKTAAGHKATQGASLADGNLSLGRTLADGKQLNTSIAAIAPVSTGRDVRLDLRPVAQLPPELFNSPTGVILPDPQGTERVTTAFKVGDSGLAVVADRPARSLLDRWRDDVSLLVIPLALGVALLLFLALQNLPAGSHLAPMGRYRAPFSDRGRSGTVRGLGLGYRQGPVATVRLYGRLVGLARWNLVEHRCPSPTHPPTFSRQLCLGPKPCP